MVDVPDLIACLKFADDRFRGLASAEGHILPFPIDFDGRPYNHRCDKRLQRLQKILCKRVYYFVNVYLNKSHISETKQNYDGKPS